LNQARNLAIGRHDFKVEHGVTRMRLFSVVSSISVADDSTVSRICIRAV
jgi:hypothetical protein